MSTQKPGRPTKEQENKNTLRREAKKAVELRLEIFKDQNKQVWEAYQIIRDYSLGRAAESVTAQQYKAAKELYEDWCKTARHADEAIKFLEGLDGEESGEDNVPHLATVATFEKRAR